MMCAPGPISGATARLIFTQTHDTVPSDRDCRPARCIAKALVKEKVANKELQGNMTAILEDTMALLGDRDAAFRSQ